MAVVVLVKDLFFKAKILETAKHANKEIKIVASLKEAAEKTGSGGLVIVDLEDFGVEGIKEFLQKNPQAKVVGFLSHVNVDLKKKAESTGCRVFARSEFSKRLAEILTF